MKKLLTILFLAFPLFLFGQVIENFESGKLNNSIKTNYSYEYSSSMDNYDIAYYGLNLNTSNSTNYISGVVTIKAKALANPLNTFTIQLINQLNVSSVKLNDQDVSFTHQSNEITFSCPSPIPEGNLFTVVVSYAGSPGVGMRNGKDKNWNTYVTWTLSESFHAYEWFPVKQSLTDKADSSDVYVTVPADLKVASNGLLKRVVDVEGNMKRYEWESRYPIDYYLIALTVSNYIEYNTYANPEGMTAPLQIQNFVYNVPGCLDFYKNMINETASMIESFSKLFGTYPFKNEKYGHVMAPIGGGMEHQTMTTLSGFSRNLISHELAHMWFGDYVTCKTWQDIWINEGFASYCEYLYLQKNIDQAAANTWMIGAIGLATSMPDGRVYLSAEEASTENRIFDYSLTYQKGAAIIHMLRHEINNDDLFFSIIKQFLARYANSTASGEDFKSVVNEVTGSDYTWFFDQWYYGYGFPTLSAQFGYTDSNTWITLSQTPSSSQTPLFKASIDLKITFQDQTTTTQRVFLTESQKTIYFNSLPHIQSIKIDPDIWMIHEVGSIASDNTLKDDDLWVSVGPNPISDRLIIKSNADSRLIHITINDITGKQVLSTTCNEQVSTIDASNLPIGIYIVRVSDGIRNSVRKIVKE